MTLDVVLLVGGRSTEHDASLHSYRRLCAAVMSAPERIALRGVAYLTRSGEYHHFTSGPWPLTEEELCAGPALPLVDGLRRLKESGAFVFSLLHGNEGEDGAWQGLAEVLQLPGSFGPVLASAVGMNKRLQSVVARDLVPGLLTPRTWMLPPRGTNDPKTRGKWADEVAAALAGAPAVVKPNRMGASLLTDLVDRPTGPALAEGVARVLPYDDQVLVQEFVGGSEFTCGVFRRGGGTVALPVVQAVTANGFLGHQEKHSAGLVNPVLHTEDSPVTRRIKEASVRLFDEMAAFGFARLDFLVRDDDLYFLEINTLPGLMHGSAFPRMLEAAGLDLVGLVEESAAEYERHPVRDKLLPYSIDHHDRPVAAGERALSHV